MPEILTESFCERCGTRYTFEAVTPKARPLTKLKILTRGLRNYVLSDETTLDEALAAARSEEQREISAQQLDAFHRTFSFCMSCRLYTCASSWNEVEGRCLTCAPDLRAERPSGALPAGAAIAPGPAGLVASLGDAGGGRTGNGQVAPTIEASAWPTVDLRRDRFTAADGAAPATEEAGATSPAFEAISTPEAVAPAAIEAALAEPEPGAPTTDAERPEAEPTAASSREPSPAEVAAASPEPALSEAPTATTLEPGPAEIGPAPSGLAAAADASEPEPPAPAPASAPAVDRVEVPVWRIVAPDTTPEAGPPIAWPTPPAPPAAPAASAPFAPPPPAASDLLWAASSRDVLNRPGSGVQACVSCGLPPSATARFCRRCGTRQA